MEVGDKNCKKVWWICFKGNSVGTPPEQVHRKIKDHILPHLLKWSTFASGAFLLDYSNAQNKMTVLIILPHLNQQQSTLGFIGDGIF